MIINHADRENTPFGYKQIVTRHEGAVSSTLWDQTLPRDAEIVPHSHPTEELLTFLSGRVEVVVADQVLTAEADMTLLIPANTPHTLKNIGALPARLLAYFPTVAPVVVTPDGTIIPVD